MLDKPDLSVYLSKSEEFLNEGMNMNVMARVGAFKQSDISRNRLEKVVVVWTSLHRTASSLLKLKRSDN